MNEKAGVKSPTNFIILAPFIFAILYLNATAVSGDYTVSELGGALSTSVYGLVYYCLGNAISIPLADPLADRYGLIKTVVIFLFLHILTSIFCVISPTYFFFLTGRVLLGFASGPFYILSRRMILNFTEGDRSKNASFFMTMFFAILPVTGGALGGLIAYEYNWRWIYIITQPFALLLALYLWIYFRDTDKPDPTAYLFNKVSFIFFTVGLICTSSAIVMGEQLDWTTSGIFNWLFVVGVACTIIYIIHDLIIEKPLLDIRILANPGMFLCFLALAMLFYNYYAIIALIGYWLHIFVSYSPLWIFVLFSVEATAAFLCYFVGYRYLKKYDLRISTGLGILSFMISCYITTYFNIYVDLFHLILARIFSGIGIVLYIYPCGALCSKFHHPSKGSKFFSLLQVHRSIFTFMGPSVSTIVWIRRSGFYYERLGEKLTANSEIAKGYLQRGVERFNLTGPQSLHELNTFLDKRSHSLALNDTYLLLSYLLLGLLTLLIITFFFKKNIRIDS